MPVADTMQKNKQQEIHNRLQTLFKMLQLKHETSLDHQQVKMNREHNALCIAKLDQMMKQGKPISYSFGTDKKDLCDKTLEKVSEYNMAHPNEQINIQTFPSDNGCTDVWVQRDQSDKFYDLQKEALNELGKVQAEMKKDQFNELANGNRTVKVSQLNEDIVNRIENKGWQNDFPYATEMINDGSMNIAVTVDHFMDGKIDPKSEDLFTTLIRQNITMDYPTKQNLKFDLDLEDKVMSYSDPSKPLYICQQKAGNSFLKVEADGFTVYAVHKDMNNPNLAVKQSVKRNDFTSKKEYNRALYKAFSEIDHPIHVTEKDLDKISSLYKNKDLSQATEQDIKDAIMYHCSKGNTILHMRPSETARNVQFKLDRVAKAYGNLLEFKLMQVEAKANMKQFTQALSENNLDPDIMKSLIKFTAKELSKENTIQMEDSAVYDTIIQKMSQFAKNNELDKEQVNCIRQALTQVSKENFVRADVLNDANLYNQAIKETTDYIISKGRNASKEWNNVMNMYGVDNDTISKIPFDKLTKAAEEVLNLNIECRTPDLEHPILTEQGREVKDYHQGTRLDESKDASTKDISINDVEFDDFDL